MVGSGAFKETYHATQGGQSLALKVFRSSGSPERSGREIAAMRRCNHPHIARLEDVDTFSHQGGEHLIVIEEFLPGGTLTGRLRDGVLSAPETRRLAAQLIGALAHIASLNLVHRDLKPDNVMFRGSGEAVIVDFGLVRDLNAESLTQTWQLTGPGTPYYASPEQLLNEKDLIDWRSDQFSLAVLLSEAALALHPYAEGGDTMSTVVDRVARRAQPTRTFHHAVSQSALLPLMRMASPWPVQRFRKTDALAAAWMQ